MEGMIPLVIQEPTKGPTNNNVKIDGKVLNMLSFTSVNRDSLNLYLNL